ncbi:N-hydroxyarylamine O-acetyltransferase [Paenibacillus uliginis N3/975]|uniref:N-hydroxyarylamine O-acetyltransferase n=2 Tax=Paenibacillus TaxID=44249 RepID=A0A1X7HBU4_9BACL|nr:N-hydroxyarylamine O-acetyltransferase [Paenibacillus uliginis N3/975]
MLSNFMDNQLDVQLYLDRIGFNGPINNSPEVLAKLQEQHVHTVPYENLDILGHIPLSLEIPDLFHKIVIERRGGYCFELNALFGWLLQELGFKVTNYFGRFWRGESHTPVKRRHHILHVDIHDRRFIADVGAGMAPRLPIELIEDAEQIQGTEIYQVNKTSSYGWMLYERKNEILDPVYSFTEEANLPQDYFTTSYWCQYSPESVFNKGAKVFIRTKDGRNTVDGHEFRIFTSDEVRTFSPSSPQEYADALYVHFGIKLPFELKQ